MRFMHRKRKPDLLAVLAFVVGLGVIVSSLAQAVVKAPDAAKTQLLSHAYQITAQR